MKLQIRLKKHQLKFSFKAGTSRGVLESKPSWIIKITDQDTNRSGWGEISLIPGLNPENPDGMDDLIKQYLPEVKYEGVKAINELPKNAPALNFGFEMAFIDLYEKGEGILFPGSFVKGKSGIPVNGLIWMGNEEEMFNQVSKKVDAGFTCIKMKIGSLDFKQELELLKKIRQHYKPEEIELRLDANGAFKTKKALENLKQLSEYDIHSIEQPVKPTHVNTLATLCKYSPIPVALDESLIGISDKAEKQALLETIKPQYIVLKPSLVGGFSACSEWIKIAEKLNIGWWVTSALESNIGLNAIAQWTAVKGNEMPQGLGTGGLFTNNVPAPLEIRNGHLFYLPNADWDRKIVESSKVV